MDNEAPTPMRRAPRNILQRVGRRLEKFEESFGIQNPNTSHRSQTSFDDDYPSHHRQQSEDYDEQEDTVSLHSLHHPHSDSPRVAFHQGLSHRLNRSHSEATLPDAQSSSHRRESREEHAKPVSKQRNLRYDQEMEIICTEIIENKPPRWHDCRDYDKKVSLLRMALSFNMPKVTVPVLIFLENSLSKPLFYELIKPYPSAIKVYLNTIRSRIDNDHYIAILKQFHKNEDAGMIHIQEASKAKDINTKLSLLDQAIIETNAHPWWNLQIIEYRYLIRKQQDLEKSFSSAQSIIHLENRTVLDTYKVLFDIDFRRQKYGRNQDKSGVEHSREIETGFHMSPEMIMCGKLSVIMQCGFRMHYEDFMNQAMHQNIFSRKYVIPPENFADMVYNWVRLSGEGQEKASEKTGKFLNMIQDPLRRIYYAEKFQNYDVAMDTIAYVLRDRIQLESLLKRIPRDHPSYNRASYILDNTKWRN